MARVSYLFTFVFFVCFSQTGYGQTVATYDGIQTGLTTLYSRDPLTQSLCLRDGGPGLVFQSGQKRNRCSDLNFHSYAPNTFSVGVEGGRRGVILDLGTPQDLQSRYGYQETVGGGQGFASIDVK